MPPTTNPDPRLPAMPVDANPDLKDAFQTYVKALGFVPNGGEASWPD
jgi:hypothetical protein